MEVWRDTLQTSWQWDCVPLHSRFEDGGGVRISAGGHPQTPGSGRRPLHSRFEDGGGVRISAGGHPQTPGCGRRPLHSRFEDGGGVRISAGGHPQTPGCGRRPLHSRFEDGGGVRISAGGHPQTPGSGAVPSALPVWELRFRGSADQPLGPLPEGRGEKIENSKETPWLNHSKSCSKRPS